MSFRSIRPPSIVTPGVLILRFLSSLCLFIVNASPATSASECMPMISHPSIFVNTEMNRMKNK